MSFYLKLCNLQRLLLSVKCFLKGAGCVFKQDYKYICTLMEIVFFCNREHYFCLKQKNRFLPSLNFAFVTFLKSLSSHSCTRPVLVVFHCRSNKSVGMLTKFKKFCSTLRKVVSLHALLFNNNQKDNYFPHSK